MGNEKYKRRIRFAFQRLSRFVDQRMFHTRKVTKSVAKRSKNISHHFFSPMNLNNRFFSYLIDAVPALNCSTISMIRESVTTNHFVEETMNSTAITDSSSNDRQSLAPYVSKLDRLDVREAKLAGPFLDGCNASLNHENFANPEISSVKRRSLFLGIFADILGGLPNKSSRQNQSNPERWWGDKIKRYFGFYNSRHRWWSQ